MSATTSAPDQMRDSHPNHMKPNPTQENDRILLRVIKCLSALSLGVMMAFLASLKQVNPQVRFEFSLWVVLAFMCGAAFSWLYWKLALNSTAAGCHQRKAFKVLGWLPCISMALPFALALRNASAERINNVAIGYGCATVALSIVGIFLWRLGKFFQDDSRGAEKLEPQ